MSLPDYKLDPPDQHEIDCRTCGGEGEHLLGRSCAYCGHAIPLMVKCEECKGTGMEVLNNQEYFSWLKEMKEAD